MDVQGSFLYGCSGLTQLDLGPLAQVTVVQGFFLYGCSGLTSLDLGPLSQVTVVQRCFLDGCHSLDAVDNPPMCPPPFGWAADVCSTKGVRKWVRQYGEAYYCPTKIRVYQWVRGVWNRIGGAGSGQQAGEFFVRRVVGIRKVCTD
jgi:hypothetical protein